MVKRWSKEEKICVENTMRQKKNKAKTTNEGDSKEWSKVWLQLFLLPFLKLEHEREKFLTCLGGATKL